MTRLSPLDASFLRVETPAAHMHIGWLATLDRPARTSALDAELLRRRIASRLHHVPRFRQVVTEPPGGLTAPRWRDDPTFDLDRHLVVHPADGDLPARELRRLADDVFSAPLARDRPLWELHVVPRLAGGRAAVVGKVHHAMGNLPAPVQARAAHLAASPRLYNLTVSNLPGPQVPLYAAGGRVRTIHPLIPIPDRHALAVGSISCGNELGFAAYADPAALRGLGRLPVLFADALAELGPAPVGRRADRGRSVAA
jgi:hypothetical protein